MRDIGSCDLMNRRVLVAACALLAAVLAGGNVSEVAAQGSGTWAVAQAQQAVRQQINNQERGRGQTIRFNNDAQTEATSNYAVRVTGTGRSSSGSNNSYGNNGRNRDFSYEALVGNRGRNRNGTVSEVRYDWRDDGGGRGRGNGNDNYGGRGGNRNDGGRGGNRPDGRISYSGPIMNRNSNKSLDVTEQSTQDGANIQQWGFADQANQNWDVISLSNGEVAILSRLSGMALTVQGGRDMNGANIIQRNWNDTRQQRWRMEDVGGGYYRILSVDNGKSLEVAGQGKQDGASIQLWDYANQSNQQWRLKR